MKKLAVFASGNGTNAEKLYSYFKEHPVATINLIVVSKQDAGIIERSKNWGVEVHILDKKEYKNTTKLLEVLQKHQIDWIILAGFLWHIPQYLTQQYPNKIVNIHPSLLPKYGGKGMYGHFVHQAVYAGKEKESGITIHYVNEVYDEGEIIFQAHCPITGLNPQQIAQAIQQLEHQHFPKVVYDLLVQ